MEKFVAVSTGKHKNAENLVSLAASELAFPISGDLSRFNNSTTGIYHIRTIRFCPLEKCTVWSTLTFHMRSAHHAT
jgi:hypothetical protein